MPMEDLNAGLMFEFLVTNKACLPKRVEGENLLVKQQWIYAYVQAVYSLTIKSEP